MMICSIVILVLLSSAVFKSAEGQTTSRLGFLDVNLNLAGRNFNVRFEPELDSTDTMANKLCTENAELVGFTEANMSSCVGPVKNYLSNAVNEWVVDRTLDVPVTIEGYTFDVSFLPEVQSSSDLATNVCTQYAGAVGTLTAEASALCNQRVSSYLQSTVNSWAAEKTLEIPLTIKDTTFDVRFLPERESAQNVATRICTEHAQRLELDENSLPGCIGPVTDYLTRAINEWVLEKTIVVDVNLNDNPYTLRFMPERIRGSAMAQRLCVEQAATLGLTEDTLYSSCVNPVADFIAEKIKLWLADKILEVPVEIGEVSTVVRFMPERESTRSVARTFCVKNATTLNLTEENIITNCLDPVTVFLQQQAQLWAAQRRATTRAVAAE